MKKLKLSNKGVSLVEVLVTAGILGIVTLSVSTLMTQMFTAQKNANVKMTLQELKDEIKAQFIDEKSWKNTLLSSANPDLACLQAFPYDCGGVINGGVINQIMSSDNTLLYDFSGTNGFDKNGLACTNYDPVGTTGCVFQVKVNFAPSSGTCASAANCKNPQVKIDASFGYNDKVIRAPVKIARYNFSITRPGTVDAVSESCIALGGTMDGAGNCVLAPSTAAQDTCTSLGGTYDSVTDTCTLSNGTLGSCPTGQYVAGINADGTKICKAFSTTIGSCPAGKYLEGIKPDGSRKCQTFPNDILSIGSCPSGEYLSGVDSTGAVVCVAMSGGGGGTGGDKSETSCYYAYTGSGIAKPTVRAYGKITGGTIYSKHTHTSEVYGGETKATGWAARVTQETDIAGGKGSTTLASVTVNLSGVRGVVYDYKHNKLGECFKAW